MMSSSVTASRFNAWNLCQRYSRVVKVQCRMMLRPGVRLLDRIMARLAWPNKKNIIPAVLVPAWADCQCNELAAL
jgi:hypothetical protein